MGLAVILSYPFSKPRSFTGSCHSSGPRSHPPSHSKALSYPSLNSSLKPRTPTQGLATVVGLAVIRLVTAKPMEDAGEPESPKDVLFNYSPSVRFWLV